jgi:hypothetical protein
MQYVMKMEETLMKDEPKTVAKAPAKSTSKAAVANTRKPNQATRTASKSQAPMPGKSYRR